MNLKKEAKSLTFGGVQKSAKYFSINRPCPSLQPSYPRQLVAFSGPTLSFNSSLHQVRKSLLDPNPPRRDEADYSGGVIGTESMYCVTYTGIRDDKRIRFANDSDFPPAA